MQSLAWYGIMLSIPELFIEFEMLSRRDLVEICSRFIGDLLEVNSIQHGMRRTQERVELLCTWATGRRPAKPA